MEKVERLKKKLEHWAEHNKEHAESFRKAAREAEEIGLVDVSRRLKEAAEEIVIDEEKGKALKTGYITLYNKFFRSHRLRRGKDAKQNR